MKHHLISPLWAAVAALFLMLSGPVFAATSFTPGDAVGTIAVPAGLSLAEVREAIAVSLVARQWTVKEKSDSRIVAQLVHRGVDATLTFKFDTQKIDLTCESWKIDKQGKRGAPELPKGWIANLQKDIPTRLNRRAAVK